MILVPHPRDADLPGPVSFSAIAAHRGDVTTVMAAAAVRLRAEQRAEEARYRDRPRSMLDAVRGSASPR